MDICLRELIETFRELTEPPTTPTPKKLREAFKDPLARSPDGTAAIYPNGYAVYDNGTGDSVIWVLGCLSYTYRFLDGKPGAIPGSHSIPEETLLSQPWYIAITLFGEDAIAYNLFNRKGDRYGSRTENRGEGDEGDTEKAARWRGGSRYETPECRVVRKAVVREMLRRLTPMQRNTVILHDYFGYTESEIAAMRRKKKGKYSVAAVSKQLWQARERLGFRKIPF